MNVRLAYNFKNSDVAQHPASWRSVVPSHQHAVAANYDFKVIKPTSHMALTRASTALRWANANNPFGGVKPTPSTDGNEILLGLGRPVEQEPYWHR